MVGAATMRVLEVRRHSLVRDHVHLSQAGVDFARRVGAGLGPFDRVVTSQITRTLETAIALGFAVDEQLADLGLIDAEVWAEIGHHERWGWAEPFATFARLVRRGGATARLAAMQEAIWRATIHGVPEGGQALVVSHGRIIELGAIACFPDADHATWGTPFDKCEGVRLTYEGDRWSGIEFIRLEHPRKGDPTRCSPGTGVSEQMSAVMGAYPCDFLAAG